MAGPQQLGSLEELLFGAPLYKTYVLPEDLRILSTLYGKTGDHRGVRIDGHCPHCSKETTYLFDHAPFSGNWSEVKKRLAYLNVSLTCVRSEYHIIRYWFLLRAMTIQKVGQYPSLADISNDEVQYYRKGMNKEDAAEFHKAIGLAAHGVGVGSFVYLRRVFERLIDGRYRSFKDEEGWTDEEFQKLRMTEKVKLLKDHLPPFLVENAGIYSILSLGIHELDEETCLGAFDIMKRSIMIILDEDKRKREELALRENLKDAIQKFTPTGGN